MEDDMMRKRIGIALVVFLGLGICPALAIDNTKPYGM
jgi:hypothetical protein